MCLKYLLGSMVALCLCNMCVQAPAFRNAVLLAQLISPGQSSLVPGPHRISWPVVQSPLPGGPVTNCSESLTQALVCEGTCLTWHDKWNEVLTTYWTSNSVWHPLPNIYFWMNKWTLKPRFRFWACTSEFESTASEPPDLAISPLFALPMPGSPEPPGVPRCVKQCRLILSLCGIICMCFSSGETWQLQSPYFPVQGAG